MPGTEIARPRVLFIEDNLTQLDLYALVLEERYQVLRATRGEQGYVIACDKQPDAIIVDAQLPDVDGLAVCERLHGTAQTASIPLIVLTGDDDAYARALTLRCVDAVRRKPCPADELLQLLQHAVSVRKIR